ncbi:MAG: nuclear transport factor 2 family protein [Desulfobacterales bacterium]
MGKLINTMLLLACTCMLLVVVDDAEAGRQNQLRQLRQDRLEIGRGMLEVQNVDWTTLLPYYAGDIEYHDSIVDVYGLDMLTQFLGRLYGSSPDLVTTIEDETLVGGKYSATWTMVGSFNGVPYEAKGISIIKFRSWSREVYYWRDYYTEGDIMTNISGFDEAILGFRTYYRCAVDPTFNCPLELATADALPEIEPLLDSPAPVKYRRGIRSRIRLRRDRLEVGRALVEINAANWQSLLPYYTDDYEYHDPIVDIYGFDTLVPFFARLFTSSPDLVTTVEDEMLIGRVYTATWTMVGQFNGVPYEAKGMSIIKFRDWSTQAYYSRDYYSESDIMATVPGLDQAVEGFRVSYRCVVDPAFDCSLPPPVTLEADGQ